ncbi:hypothetical protein ACOY7R_23175, partial [Enterobacter kobei]
MQQQNFQNVTVNYQPPMQTTQAVEIKHDVGLTGWISRSSMLKGQLLERAAGKFRAIIGSY